MKSVTVVVMMGDRGLCGGYNAKMIKLAERRIKELKDQGYEVGVITIGTKGTTYFKSRTKLVRTFEMGQAPSPATAAAIAEELLSEYLSGEVRSVDRQHAWILSRACLGAVVCMGLGSVVGGFAAAPGVDRLSFSVLHSPTPT